jgi:acetyl-CoA acetyltransferase
LFFIGNVMDWVYGLWDCDWLSVNGGLTTMGHCGRSGAREVVVIARRERERGEVVKVLTNCAT